MPTSRPCEKTYCGEPHDEFERRRAALAGMVDLYLHPDTGGIDMEADAFKAAKAALGEGEEP